MDESHARLLRDKLVRFLETSGFVVSSISFAPQTYRSERFRFQLVVDAQGQPEAGVAAPPQATAPPPPPPREEFPFPDALPRRRSTHAVPKYP